MKRFRFELESLLILRQNERDVARQALSQLLQQEADLIGRGTEVETRRQAQFDELRRDESGDELDVEASRLRRSYAARLTNELDAIDHEHTILIQQIDAARQVLLRADQSAKALEKISDRRAAAFLADAERRDALEIEETWRSLQALGRAGQIRTGH
jgi:flagellar biosynthesis chaperone FliJ